MAMLSSSKVVHLLRSFSLTAFVIVSCLWIWSFYIIEEFPNMQNGTFAVALEENTERINANVEFLKSNDVQTLQLEAKHLENESITQWTESLNQMLKEFQLSEMENNKKNFQINKERGFWSGNDSVNFHIFDEPLAKELLKFFKSERANDVIDLGGGMGKYTEYFSSRGLLTRCYDGNPDSQEISEGRCAVLDFTKEIRFLPFDWVLSLEVGEHLPKMYESMYLKNIDRLNKKGVVMSWAIEGQGGSGHVNNQNNTYVIQKMKDLNYTYDHVCSDELRRIAFWGWFNDTIMIFRKFEPSSDNQTHV